MVAIGEDTRCGKVDDSLAEVEVEERVDSKRIRSVISRRSGLQIRTGRRSNQLQCSTVSGQLFSLRTFLFRLPRRDVLQW